MYGVMRLPKTIVRLKRVPFRAAWNIGDAALHVLASMQAGNLRRTVGRLPKGLSYWSYDLRHCLEADVVWRTLVLDIGLPMPVSQHYLLTGPINRRQNLVPCRCSNHN